MIALGWYVSIESRTDLGFLDAVGPEKLTVGEFLRLLAEHASKPLFGFVPRLIVPALPESVAEAIVPGMFNTLLRDIWVHSTEMRILHQDIATSESDRDPLLENGEGAVSGDWTDQQYWGVRKLSSWVEEHGETLGEHYINTMDRYYDGKATDVPAGN